MKTPKTARLIRVMVASPSEASEERRAIPEIITRWNAVHGDSFGVQLQPVMWETDATPGLEGRPQDMINNSLVCKSDLLIAVFRSRIGSPTGKEISGTVEEVKEFRKASKPILLYFYEGNVSLRSVDAQQLTLLTHFKQEMLQAGLVADYVEISQIRERLPDDLTRVVRDMVSRLSRRKGTTESIDLNQMQAPHSVEKSASDARTQTATGNVLSRERTAMWALVVIGFALIVTMAFWQLLKEFGTEPSYIEVRERFVQSFREPGVVYSYVVWVVFLTIYGSIWCYELVQHHTKPRDEANLVARNYYYTLWVWGVLSMLIQHATLAASSSIALPLPPWLLTVLVALLGVWGMFLVFVGRIYINGYWTNHIYRYPNQEIVQQGIYANVRHPIYGGQILIACSLFLACNNWWLLFLPLMTSFYNFKRAVREEGLLNELTSGQYEEYSRKTPNFMFYPF